MPTTMNSRPEEERRAADRFPLECEARYTVMDTRATLQCGKCRTVNMSSRGILFQTDTRLHEGKRVELAVSWPARLNATCPIKLVAVGRVVRSSFEAAAIEIERYEFRTQGSAGLHGARTSHQ
jgi:hypothetical protein